MQQYLDRRGIVARAQARGIPLKLAQLEKDGAAGCGPRVTAKYGGKGLHLHTPEDADAYINSKLTIMSEAAE